MRCLPWLAAAAVSLTGAVGSKLHCHWNVEEGKHYNPPWFGPGRWGLPTSERFKRDVVVYYEANIGLSPAVQARRAGGGPGGIPRMMLDRATNTTYKDWPANYERWMSEHLALCKSGALERGTGPDWNSSGTPPGFAGVAAFDYETFRPSWSWSLRTNWGQPADECKPLEGDGPCTNTWSKTHREWATFVSNVSSPTFDRRLLQAAFNTSGFAPPAGVRGWAGLSAAGKLALLRSTYNHFAEDFYGRTYDYLHVVLPKAKWGQWAVPMSAFPNTGSWYMKREFVDPETCPNTSADFPCTTVGEWQALQDELMWLYERLDVFLPSFYSNGWVSEPGEPVCGPASAGAGGWERGCGEPSPGHNCPTEWAPIMPRYSAEDHARHLRSNLEEVRRIRRAVANATGRAPPVMPYVYWHSTSAAAECGEIASRFQVFISPTELRQTWEILADEPEVDDLILWGDPANENMAILNHTREINVSAYFNQVWGPYAQQYCAAI